MLLAHIHAAAATAWLGLLAAEVVIELSGRDAASRRWVAQTHARIDALFELPLVLTVLGTGGLLLMQVWPAPVLLWIKIGSGLIGIVANLVCIPFVRQRLHARDDAEAQRLTRRVALTGLAIPFVLLAFGIGLGAYAR